MTTLVDDPRADTAPPQTAAWLIRSVANTIDADPWAATPAAPPAASVDKPSRRSRRAPKTTEPSTTDTAVEEPAAEAAAPAPSPSPPAPVATATAPVAEETTAPVAEETTAPAATPPPPAPPSFEAPSRSRQPVRTATAPAAKELYAEAPRRLRHWLPWAAMVVISLAWFVTLRPEQWGGPATYVVVRGVSMEPTFHPGDVVITRRAPAYGIGDVVAYRVSAGEIGAGTIVIHRIVGGSAVDGFITKGDNNPDLDDWHPLSDDVLGRAWIHVPGLGQVMVWLSRPPGTAALVAVAAAAFALFSSTVTQRRDVAPGTRSSAKSRRRGAGERTAAP
ncbi:MAG: signal peptidase I [Actinomycetota bacterium]